MEVFMKNKWFSLLFLAVAVLATSILNAVDCVLMVNGIKLSIVQGDITKQEVDVIVNAANEDLQHGGGVAAAIRKAAGGNVFQNMCNNMPYITKKQFNKQCPDLPFRSEKERCPMGYAVKTNSGDLNKIGIKAVIHTTGPRGVKAQYPTVYPSRMVGRDDAQYRKELLEHCYSNSLKVASENKFTSIAFPSISTAIFGYPIKDAAPVAIKAVKNYFEQNPTSTVKEVVFVLFSQQNKSNDEESDFDVYKNNFAQLKTENNKILTD
jgi:O-acetyl-ADP-ribose deacetylase (regulator of RNase III)